jgi:flavin-dependent dehydrogenase
VTGIPDPVTVPARFDVLVYGATSGGVAAAVAAARAGATVALVDPTDHVGDMVALESHIEEALDGCEDGGLAADRSLDRDALPSRTRQDHVGLLRYGAQRGRLEKS